jgi:hypothetical protein
MVKFSSSISTTNNAIVIAIVISALAIGPALLTDHITKAQPTKTWCQSQSGKSNNWKSGCESGAGDCRGGKSYDPGKGHTRDYHLGYDAGWTHSGCK